MVSKFSYMLKMIKSIVNYVFIYIFLYFFFLFMCYRQLTETWFLMMR